MPFGSKYDDPRYSGLVFDLLRKLFGWPFDIGTRQRARDTMICTCAKQNERILDAGCGMGVTSLEMALQGAYVTGIDTSFESIRYAMEATREFRLTGKLEFKIASICNLPFKDDSFHKILCLDVLEHIENDFLACSEFARVLKKKGMLIIHVPQKWQSQFRYFVQDVKDPFFWKKYGHVRNGYDPGSLKALLESNNFKIVCCKHTIKTFGILAWEIGLRIGKSQAFVFPFLNHMSRLDRVLSNRRGNGLLAIAERT